jgi:hypothetical protein
MVRPRRREGVALEKKDKKYPRRLGMKMRLESLELNAPDLHRPCMIIYRFIYSHIAFSNFQLSKGFSTL